VVGTVPGLIAYHTFLHIRGLAFFFLLFLNVYRILVLAWYMFGHNTPRGRITSLPTTPPHLPAELRGMNLTAPVIVLRLVVILVTVLTLAFVVLTLFVLSTKILCALTQFFDLIDKVFATTLFVG
jgi:Na+/H+ antiporter NhaC